MSEQATCQCGEFEYRDGAWRSGVAYVANQEDDFVQESGHCPTCGTRLNADGTETQMVPEVVSEEVREAVHFMRRWVGESALQPTRSSHPWNRRFLLLLDAAEQSGACQRAAEWLAEKIQAQSDCDTCQVVSSGPCGGDCSQCATSFLAEALAAAGGAQEPGEPGDAALLDALKVFRECECVLLPMVTDGDRFTGYEVIEWGTGDTICTVPQQRTGELGDVLRALLAETAPEVQTDATE